MKSKISHSIRNDLLSYKILLKKQGIKVSKIIVFGSIAKGTGDKYSDIDVAVVSPKFGKNYQKEMVKLMLQSHKINNLIEPLPFNERELNNKYSALANEVRKYGIEVK